MTTHITKTWFDGEKVVTQEIPESEVYKQEPDGYGYARRLAEAIWNKHYKAATPQWKPFDDLMGVLTQIDNMTAGLTAQRQPLTDEEIDDIWNRYCDEMGEASINDAYDIARAIEAKLKEKNNG